MKRSRAQEIVREEIHRTKQEVCSNVFPEEVERSIVAILEDLQGFLLDRIEKDPKKKKESKA